MNDIEFGITQEMLLAQKAPDGPQHKFITSLVTSVLDGNRIDLEDPEKAIVVQSLRGRDLSLRPGKPEDAILAEADQLVEQGPMRVYVEMFANRGEIKTEKLTPGIKKLMVDHLLNRGFNAENITDAQFNAGAYDEHFAVAYEFAVAHGSGKDDPIDNVRVKNAGETLGAWDFVVDEFEDIEEQGIIRENILAAGVLYYISEIGERMGVFEIANTIVLDAYSLNKDITGEVTTNRILRYYKLLSERTSDEERKMLYKRVLNRGNPKLLSRMVVNEDFPHLWRSLMNEVATFIDKSERLDNGLTDSTPVSRSPIFNATKELQYNITENCPGMARKQIQEIYAQLEEAMELLRDSEIVEHYGNGRRKSMWAVIDQASKEQLGHSVNISAIRTLAVEGNRIFRWIATFDETTVTPDEFLSFIESAEAYILSMASVEPDTKLDNDQEEDEFADDDFDEFDSEDEEFAEAEFGDDDSF